MPSFSTTLPSALRRGLRMVGVMIAVALPLGAGGCASAAGNPFDGGSAGRQESRIQIEVRNRNFSDATIYVLRLGQPIRLGVVRSQNEEVFSLTWPEAIPVQVTARLIAGETCTSREVLVNNGDRLTVELPQNVSINGVCDAR